MLPTKITHRIVVFTDLDGTLLDAYDYSFEPALPALHMIRQNGIPLVLSSSKTRAELTLYRENLKNEHPFISENGGGIFIPKNYFSFPFHYDRESEEYLILELGTSYSRIIGVLDSIRKETGISIKGFSDLSENELSSLCGLPKGETQAAKQREYDEPFVMEGGEKELELVKRKIREKGMNYAWGGKFHHLFGENDKGKAAGILKELYEIQFSRVSTVGIGNSLNDLPMLSLVDYPIVLKEKGGPLPEALWPIQNITVIHGEGPAVWNEVIRTIVSRLKI